MSSISGDVYLAIRGHKEGLRQAYRAALEFLENEGIDREEEYAPGADWIPEEDWLWDGKNRYADASEDWDE